MKQEHQAYLIKIASVLQAHADDGCMLEVTPELCSAWAQSLVAIVEDSRPKIILPT
jgi:hypothetical protein